MNLVILAGNLGADGELKTTQAGESMLRLRLATEENYMDDSGQWQQRPEWHTVIVWGKRAASLAGRCTKGRPVAVQGRLRTRSWEDKDGNQRKTTEVVAKAIKVYSGYAQAQAAEGGPNDDDFEGDIPF